MCALAAARYPPWRQAFGSLKLERKASRETESRWRGNTQKHFSPFSQLWEPTDPTDFADNEPETSFIFYWNKLSWIIFLALVVNLISLNLQGKK